MIILERLGDGIAVISEDGLLREISARLISADARDGDVLFRANGIYAPDKAATAERRCRVAKLQNSLWDDNE